MFGSEYLGFLIVAVLFPFSMIQMGAALDREDLEGFWMWTCVASFIAGLPFMTMFAI
jgi:hypothetical protein